MSRLCDTVIKRNGDSEEVSFDKVLNRIKSLSNNLLVNPTSIAQKVCSRIYNGVNTSELDEMAASICANLSTEHPDHSILASRIIVSNHHKNTSPSFSETIYVLYTAKDINGNPMNLIDKKLYDIVMKNKEKLNSIIKYDRDFLIDYFGFKTLEKSYLIKVNDKVVERPQHLFMRVALCIHGDDFKDALNTYELMSNKYFIHATPTLYNSGTPRPQLSSCFLLTMKDDSINGIFSTLKDCALISKWAGGIGLSVHNVRSTGSQIRGTNGISNGLIPMLRVFNNTARYVDQGGGKRKGSIAVYLEPWHTDIMDFMKLKKNIGNEEERARDLFYALWIPDLFMKKVEEDAIWYLMCPDECPGLADTWGEEFETLYQKYVDEGKYRSKISAQQLWFSILESQIETGTPYLLYKDAANRKSNQQNLGTIKSSNLCCEIVEYTSPEETAVCNLASICLPTFINQNKEFDYPKLLEISKTITKNLNKIIDINFYPIPEAELSNKRHRPIGIGVQGLADVFAMLKIPFDSEEAKVVNRKIFETIYFGAMTESMEISKKRQPLMVRYKEILQELNLSNYQNAPEESPQYPELMELHKVLKPVKDEIQMENYLGCYSSYNGSPMSKGQFQFDLWEDFDKSTLMWDWEPLKQEIAQWGIRNSLLVAPMPTASTSQIMGNNECIEPYTSNIYVRRTLAGEFTVINRHLINTLIQKNIWNEDIKNKIIENDGSVLGIDEIPEDIQELFKTVWEVSQKKIIDMAADRGPFVCQSQSMNLFIAEPEYGALTSMHFYTWKKGLKTGIYYLRNQPKAKTQKFTVEPTIACESCSG